MMTHPEGPTLREIFSTEEETIRLLVKMQI